ncbi:MAG: PDDEXK nuclease domain-containing protein [Cyanobacteria bacterium J06636_16]
MEKESGYLASVLPYFLTIAKEATAQDLKRALMAHMRDFLLELGVGFSFVRQNYHLEVDGQDYYVDMLFYHLKLRCFIVIQLEMGDFQPEHSGRMNFFLSGVDDMERGAQDQPTIGLILCQVKGRTVVEYALRHLNNPIAVAEHSFPEALPSEEQLQFELDNAARLLEAEEILEADILPKETTATPEELAEAALEVQRRLKLLQEMNPAASQEEISAFFTAAMPLTLRQQAASALQSLGKAAVQDLLEDAYADTAIALMESWRNES